MNSTANRLGKDPGAVTSAKAGSDSSQGSAMVTPAPARIRRREMLFADFLIRLGILVDLSVQKLRAGDDGLDQRSKAIAARGQGCGHLLDQRLVGELERAAERIGEQFAADVVDEILLPVLANIFLHAFESRTLASAGKNRVSIDRMAGQIVRPAFANRPVAFERQA